MLLKGALPCACLCIGHGHDHYSNLPGSDHSQIPEASLSYLEDLPYAYLCIGHSHDHFGAIFGNATGLVLLPHHEAIDVLQEDQGHSPLRAQLDEMGSYSSNKSSQCSFAAGATFNIIYKHLLLCTVWATVPRSDTS